MPGSRECSLGRYEGECRLYGTGACRNCVAVTTYDLYRLGESVDGYRYVLRRKWVSLQEYLMEQASREEWVTYGDFYGC